MPDKQKYFERIKSHYEAITGIKIPDDVALVIFENLVTLVNTVYRPIPKEFFECLRCPSCGKLVDLNKITDELSKKEFVISGLCQDCQDKTFK